MAVVDAKSIVASYDPDKVCVAVIASHSALQVLHGAKQEGLRTALIATPSRWQRIYSRFQHLVDHLVLVDTWKQVAEKAEELRRLNAILVPHGSLVEYVGPKVAEELEVPIFGLRGLYRWEADQKLKMKLLAEAGIRIPRIYENPDDVDRLVIVKLPGAKGGRGYFLAREPGEIKKRLAELVEKGVIRSPEEAMIQEYVVGVPMYYHYFYSPLLRRVELTGIDIRYESSVDGLRRLPPSLAAEYEPEFTVVGNIPVVIRESLLEKVFEYGDRFAEATKKLVPPGIIGPYCLESIVTSSCEVVVFEFSGRIVAGTNIYVHGSPYTWLYWDKPVSAGRRIAMEIRMAAERGKLDAVVT